MKWQKCRKPEEWVCDNCRVCGGCTVCRPQVMYHRGKDEALCAGCLAALKSVEVSGKVRTVSGEEYDIPSAQLGRETALDGLALLLGLREPGPPKTEKELALLIKSKISVLEDDLELLRSFLWDDMDEAWPEDVREVLQRAMDRLTGL